MLRKKGQPEPRIWKMREETFLFCAGEAEPK